MYEVTDGKNYKRAAGPAGPKPSGKTQSPEAGANPAPGRGVSTAHGKRFVEHAHAPGKAGSDEDGATYGNVMPDSPMEEATESRAERRREAAAGDSD